MEDIPPIHLYYPQFASLHQGEDLQVRWKSKDSYVLNLEGWDEEGEGREVQKGGYIYTIFPSALCCWISALESLLGPHPEVLLEPHPLSWFG